MIPKKVRAEGIKDFCSISLIESIYKIVAEVLVEDSKGGCLESLGRCRQLVLKGSKF